MKKFLLLAVTSAFVLVGCSRQSQPETTTAPEVTTEGESMFQASPDVSTGVTLGETTDEASDSLEKGGVKEFTVVGDNFAFDVKEMKVKKGDTVRIVFQNKEGLHDWVLDEFEGAKTKQLKEGEEETIEFVADKTGTFEYYCSVMQHRKMGMVGKLIVE